MSTGREAIEVRWRAAIERLCCLRADVAANRPLTDVDREWLARIDTAVADFLRRFPYRLVEP